MSLAQSIFLDRVPFTLSYDYIIYTDGTYVYAFNTKTKQIEFVNTDASTVVQSAINALPNGGIIKLAVLTINGNIIIGNPGIYLEGGAVAPGIQFSNTTTNATTINGNVSISAENVMLRNIRINGNLTFEATPDLSNIAHYCICENVAVYGTVNIVGASGADSGHVPFNIFFIGGDITISTAGGTCVNLISEAPSAIGHIYFIGTAITQLQSGTLINIQGNFADVHFTNCLIFPASTGVTVISLAPSPVNGYFSLQNFTIDGCSIEVGATDTTFLYVPSSLSGNPISILVNGGAIVGNTLNKIIDDNTTGGRAFHRLVFIGTQLTDQTSLRFRQVWSPPQVQVMFIGCQMKSGVTVTQLATGVFETAVFRNNMNFNPKGLLATPFVSNVISLLGTGSPAPSTDYRVSDVDVMIQVTGGTGVSITIKDPAGNIVISGVSTLPRTLLPIGYTINFGAFTVAPTVIVEGL